MVSDPVRWGFLGAGGIARTALAPAVHAATGAALQAVAARDLDRGRALGPLGEVYADYADVIADPQVDAVYVALANDAHRPWTERALAAGRAVLCEKPLGLSAAEVDAMAAAATAAGRPLVEASMYRWHPRVRRAAELLADGAVGSVREVRAGFSFPGVPEDNYRLDPAMGGGALYDIGCYAVSAALWAFGTPPVAVTARTDLHPGGVDRTADLVVEFPDGRAELHVSMVEPERQWLEIDGEAGTLELPGTPYSAWVDTPTELVVSRAGSTDRLAVPATDPYRVMVEEVSRAARGEPAYVVALTDSRATAAVLDAAFASAAAGGVRVAV